MSQRLYKAEWVYSDDHVDIDDLEDWELELECEYEPEGWREHALEVWGDTPREGEFWPRGHKPFFWPKTGVPYRSRSSAQARVDIINRWGGKAVVMECTPQWETVEAANARRATARIDEQIARREAAIVDLYRRRDAISGVEPTW